ncbi:aminoglycoside phosphotransferase (plasmid) [Embleya sp. NBC_00888]|uniref:aminoglycoside phosphotransferase n=1 Tax=Embleya sp. NBC_00888 TaxID=2975960 RepID=UPI002F9106FD|nr:aminoglycoside phosphotransferase [Embleya sp. NBC_00888]
MAIAHVGWDRLPVRVREAVRGRLGVQPVVADTVGGANCGASAVLTLPDGRTVFVKAQRERERRPAPVLVGAPAGEVSGWWGSHWEPVDELDQEERVNAFLPASAPRVLWRLEVAGWHLLAFEGIDGRHADYTPGSPDLALVVDALAELGGCPVPGLRLPSAWDRWGYWCGPAQKHLLTGTSLLHTDPAACNVLVDGTRARLVDWAWPALGPAWIDAALWGLRLVSAGGHTPEQARAWVSRTPGWRDATPDGVRAFTLAEARRWDEEAADGVWGAEALAHAAHAWASLWT